MAPPSHPSGRKYSVRCCLRCAGKVNQITITVIGDSVLEFPLQQRGSFVSTDENVGDITVLGHYFIWLMSCVTSCRYYTARVGDSATAVCAISGVAGHHKRHLSDKIMLVFQQIGHDSPFSFSSLFIRYDTG